MENSEIIKMSHVIQEYLVRENLKEAKPKDLMPILIEKGFFNKDVREGLPLRKILRDLDSENQLQLIPQVRADRKNKNVFWYFNFIMNNDT